MTNLVFTLDTPESLNQEENGGKGNISKEPVVCWPGA